MFPDDRDREGLFLRLKEMMKERSMEIYAWSLLPNHLHLLCKTRKRPFVKGVWAEADEKA
jgi:REP element-mobilizing transposase RayT